MIGRGQCHLHTYLRIVPDPARPASRGRPPAGCRSPPPNQTFWFRLRSRRRPAVQSREFSARTAWKSSRWSLRAPRSEFFQVHNPGPQRRRASEGNSAENTVCEMHSHPPGRHELGLTPAATKLAMHGHLRRPR